MNSLSNNSPEKKSFMKLEFSNAEECYELNFDGYNQNETYFLSCLIYTKVAEIFTWMKIKKYYIIQ